MKLQHSDRRVNLVKDLFKKKFPPIRALESLTGHVIFKLRYNQIYQLKTTMIWQRSENSTCEISFLECSVVAFIVPPLAKWIFGVLCAELEAAHKMTLFFFSKSHFMIARQIWLTSSFKITTTNCVLHKCFAFKLETPSILGFQVWHSEFEPLST